MTTEPITRPITGSCQIGWPDAPLITHTEPPAPVFEPLSVPSTTCSEPLPSTSASAGLDEVAPSRVSDHSGPQLVLNAISTSVSLAPA